MNDLSDEVVAVGQRAGELRGLAEEKQVGLGKVAQPLRVALCGTTISPPIFNSVELLGKENVFKRIDITLGKFGN